MKVKDENIEKIEWEKLVATGKQIIENASRDVIMWTKIVEQAEEQLKKYESN